MKSQFEAVVGYDREDAANPEVAERISIINELNDEIQSLRLNLAQLRETRETLAAEISQMIVEKSGLTVEQSFRRQI